MESIKEKLSKMAADIEHIKTRSNQKIAWSEDETESGIKLQGSTKVTREGLLVSLTPLPTQNGLAVVALVKMGDGTLKVVTGPFGFID